MLLSVKPVLQGSMDYWGGAMTAGQDEEKEIVHSIDVTCNIYVIKQQFSIKLRKEVENLLQKSHNIVERNFKRPD